MKPSSTTRISNNVHVKNADVVLVATAAAADSGESTENSQIFLPRKRCGLVSPARPFERTNELSYGLGDLDVDAIQ